MGNQITKHGLVFKATMKMSGDTPTWEQMWVHDPAELQRDEWAKAIAIVRRPHGQKMWQAITINRKTKKFTDKRVKGKDPYRAAGIVTGRIASTDRDFLAEDELDYLSEWSGGGGLLAGIKKLFRK